MACPEWLRGIVECALLTAMRVGEIVRLRWRHVDFDGGTITIEETKSGRPRTIPLHPYLADQWRPRRGLPEGFVFLVRGRGTVSVQTVSNMFRRAANRVGVSLRFHDTRHVAITRMINAGVPLFSVMAIAGHTSAAMTRRYVTTTTQEMRHGIETVPVPATSAPNKQDKAA